MSDLLVETKGTTAWITINRPDARNALSRRLNRELGELVLGLEENRDIRAVVITGAGDKAFCAGADLKERKGVSADDTGEYVNAISTAINNVAQLRKLTIAALNGSAFGGGLELALACDLRIAVEGAELGLTEVRLGIMPGAGGTVRLPRLIGEARAKEMILLGRRISVQRAYEIGLVNEVVARGQLHASVEQLLTELNGCAPISIVQAKRSIEKATEVPVDQALELERTCYDVTLFTDDRNEGLAAFAEGRPPQYKGR